jgi:hypothetical protein
MLPLVGDQRQHARYPDRAELRLLVAMIGIAPWRR